MIRSRVRLAAAVVLATAVAAPYGAIADTTPTYFPETSTIDTTAYTLRLAGADRFATAGTLARVAAVNAATQGGYPFEEPDRNEPATAYGFASCPQTVGIAAGDTVADALAAAPLKDVTTTVGTTPVDMTDAVLLVTESGRQGATDLSPSVRETLEDLADANCDFDAVVFGGEVSVPGKALTTLDALAGTVVRLSGENRFGTAARIATGLATGGLPTVTVHEDAETPAEKTNTVIIAEAFTGADALSVGPFAAANNVPILLASGADLQAETRAALEEMQPDTLIVLGGEEALPPTAVDAAAEVSGGAEVVRIAGENRYETSVLIAQQLFGLFESAAAEDHSNLGVGFARSEGAAADHLGFPDALAAAWFLDTFNDKATAPRRLAPPVELNNGTTDAAGEEADLTIGGIEAPSPAPLLLTQQAELPAEVADYLASLWPDAAAIKTAETPDATNDGGFGFLFGGEAAISDVAEASVAGALSGGTYDVATATDVAPALDPDKVFYTSASFTLGASEAAGGVDADGATGPGDKVCVTRGGMTGVRWLTLYSDTATDAVLHGALPADYEDAAEGAYLGGESRFQCVAATGITTAEALGMSLSGHDTTAKSLDWGAAASLLRTTTPGQDLTATIADGSDDITAEVDFLTGETTATHTYNGTMAVTVDGTTFPAAPFRLDITFTRTDSGDITAIPGGGPDSITFEATFAFTGTGAPNVTFESVVGESATTTSPLRLVGMYASGTNRGAFVATVSGGGTSFQLRDLVLDGHI